VIRRGRPIYLGKKGNFPKKRSVEKLISFLGAFHRKMNHVKCRKVISLFRALREN